jgi:hypothetical protein
VYPPITGELMDMFGDDVIVEPFLSVDSHGVVTYGPPTTYPARVIGRSRMALDADGREHVSNVQAMFPGEFGLSAQDRYTLPVRFSSAPRDPDNLYGRQPVALAVDRSTDENGPHHQTVYFTLTRSRGF